MSERSVNTRPIGKRLRPSEFLRAARKIIECHGKGMPVNACAAAAGVGEDVVLRVLRRHGLVPGYSYDVGW